MTKTDIKNLTFAIIAVAILVTLGFMYFIPTKVALGVTGGIVIAFVSAFKDMMAVLLKEESATQPLIDALQQSEPKKA